MLVNGTWTENWQPVQASDNKGGFVRQTSAFRNWITADGSPRANSENAFPAERDRYHLYVAYICPWACRTLIARKLKGLEEIISISVVEPFLTDQGWRFGVFPGSTQDTVNSATHMHEIYTQVDSTYTGRATVPVLWDKKTATIVNNESADILKILNSGFNEITGVGVGVDIYPQQLREEIDYVAKRLYHTFNNGVYRAGFAKSQAAYKEAVSDVFSTLEWMESRFAEREFLVGNQVTEADIRAFVTLIRFDAAYYGLFKCNLKHIWNYPNVWSYLNRLYEIPAFNSSVNMDHIKSGYYSIKALNPTGLIPLGPNNDLFKAA